MKRGGGNIEYELATMEFVRFEENNAKSNKEFLFVTFERLTMDLTGQ